jgi:hypothetical protein
MEVKSPIGELPFEVTEVQIGRHGVEVHGAMGAWPTEVSIPWADLPVLAGRTLRPAVPYLATLMVVSLAALATRGRRG